MVKCRASNQRDLEKFEDQANRNFVKVSNGKKKGVHLRWTKPTHWSRLRRDRPSSSSVEEAEKGFTVTVGLSVSPKRALTACILGCRTTSLAGRLRDVITRFTQHW